MATEQQAPGSASLARASCVSSSAQGRFCASRPLDVASFGGRGVLLLCERLSPHPPGPVAP